MAFRGHSTNPFVNSTNPFVNDTNPFESGFLSPQELRQSPVAGVSSTVAAEQFLDDCYRRYVCEETTSVEQPVAAKAVGPVSRVCGPIEPFGATIPKTTSFSTPPIPTRRRYVPSGYLANRLLPSTTAVEVPPERPSPDFRLEPAAMESTRAIPSVNGDEVGNSKVETGESTKDLLRELVGQFTQVVRGVSMNQSSKSNHDLKLTPPRFDGQGDVHLFIKQFREVAQLSNWDGQVSLVHLRSSLDRAAKDCSRADSVEEVFSRLINMFGLSPPAARERLHTLKQQPNESYFMLGNRVERLVRLAYEHLGPDVEVQMALEHFDRALTDSGLRRHMLVVKPETLSEAVYAAECYAQVSGQSTKQFRGLDRLAHVEAQPIDISISDPNSGTELENKMDRLTSKLDEQLELFKAHEERLTYVEKGLKRSGFKPNSYKSTGKACFVCGDPSHFKRDCPKRSKLIGNDVRVKPFDAQNSGN